MESHPQELPHAICMFCPAPVALQDDVHSPAPQLMVAPPHAPVASQSTSHDPIVAGHATTAFWHAPVP